MNKNRLEEREKLLRMRDEKTKRLAVKSMLNLHTVSDALDQVMVELKGKAGREPEIAAAVEVILAAKRLLKAYSQRMLNEPFKADTDLIAYPVVYPDGYVKPVEMMDIFLNLLENAMKQIALWWGTDYIADPKADKMFENMMNEYRVLHDTVSEIKKYFRDASKTAYRGNYDQFETAGSGFDGPRDIMQRQKEKRDELEKKRLDRKIERQTEQQFKQRTGESICHDENGQFVDCDSPRAVASYTVRAIDWWNSVNLGNVVLTKEDTLMFEEILKNHSTDIRFEGKYSIVLDALNASHATRNDTEKTKNFIEDMVRRGYNYVWIEI